MANPAGDYPGRQIGIGRIASEHIDSIAFFYFGSGRSPQSQGRYASRFLSSENAVRINPVDRREEFDQFRHYQAVRIDPKTGIAVISNSQSPVEPILEACKYHPAGAAKFDRMHKILAAVGPEYDNMAKRTSRILGALFPHETAGAMGGFLGITTEEDTAVSRKFIMEELEPGQFFYVPTYNGNIEYGNFNPIDLKVDKTMMRVHANSARQLADEIYEMSDYADPKYGELRVWCVAGVRNKDAPGGWEISRRNRHEVE